MSFIVYLFYRLAVIFLLVIPLSYVLFFFLLIKGWNKLYYTHITSNKTVSILIPFRNESDSLTDLIKSLNSLEYEPANLEIIFIDDHSDDNSSLIIKNIKWNHKIIHLEADVFGKKNAVTTGLKNAANEIIVCTDADCTFSPEWLHGLLSPFKNENIKIVLGGVVLSGEHHILSAFEKIEFISLVAAGASFCGLGHPIYGNGANLAFCKSAVKELDNPFNAKKSSGDDVFLIHSIKKKYHNAIAFTQHPNSIVRAKSTKTLSEFIRQRIRWASKSASYTDSDAVSLSIYILLFNLALTILLVGSFFCSCLFYTFVITYVTKTLLDLIFFMKIDHLLGTKKYLKHIFYFQMIYMIYITIIGTSSLLITPSWKGRKIK